MEDTVSTRLDSEGELQTLVGALRSELSVAKRNQTAMRALVTEGRLLIHELEALVPPR